MTTTCSRRPITPNWSWSSGVRWLFEPGLWANASVRTALLVGAIVAIVSAAVGLFTVLRGQSFAGHALTDVATAGGAGAFLVGVAPLAGFILGGVAGAGAMDVIGVQRVKGRDIATGVVLGGATALAALFLYLSTTQSSATGTTQLILFGSIFTVQSSTLPEVLVLSAVLLLTLAVIGRPLLLSSLSGDLAAARGVRLRAVGLTFMVILAVSVGLSSIIIGSILSTALLIGPPASALKLAQRFGAGLIAAMALGVAATLLGIVLAYDSYYWSSSHRSLPVSFFVVCVVVVEFVLASSMQRWRRSRLPAQPHAHAVNEPVGWH
jgi:zinc/manganese transport system permease protein